MRNAVVAAACVAAASLSGCASLGQVSPYEVGRRINGEYLRADTAWTNRFNTSQDPADRSNLARELAFQLMGRSDRKCEDYLVGISTGNNTIGGSLDLLSLGLSFAGAGASSLGSANDLATGSGIIQSLRQTSDTRLFAGHDMGTIYRAVHDGRNAERQKLMKAITDGQFDTWGPEAIAAVVNAYDVKCGVNYANSLIREAVEEHVPTPDLALPGDPAVAPAPAGETKPLI